MSTLILDNRSLSLKAEGRALAIHEGGVRHGTVPLKGIERLVIHGDADLGANVLGRLGEAGVTVLILAKRNLRRRAILLGPSHNDVGIRLAQALRVQDDDFRTEWANRLVSMKLRRQYRLLDRALARRPDRRKPLFDAQRQIGALLSSVENGDRLDIPSLRGTEGAAARAYFGGLSALVAPALGFSGRNRRPPRDPINACLSLGYTLLHFDAVRAAHIAGLDPLLGYYHRPAHGRESLASDLIEPLRPGVDAFVLGLFRDGRLRDEHFDRRDGGCFLGKAGRSTFYAAWEARARRPRRLLSRQARTLASLLCRDGERWLDSLDDEGWLDD